MSCKRCQGRSKDGSPCKRKASCEVDCHIFCWQHAEKWSKTKGCTSKKLYQYRKKPGPKSGGCGPDEMIGASGICVKRTPDNLKAKKKALAKRKLGSSDVKRGRGKRDEDPSFIEIEEIPESLEIPIESSDDESLETEESGLSDARELRECRYDMSFLRQEYMKEKRDKQALEGLTRECKMEKQYLQNAYDLKLAQATAKEQDVASCRADLERLRLEYESRKEDSLQKLDKLQEEHDVRLSELSEQKGYVEACERDLNNLRGEYQEQRESNNRELADLRRYLQDHQRAISDKERERSSLEEEVKLLSQRLLLQGIDEGRVEQARDNCKELIEEKDKVIEERRLAFANLFQEYNDLKESGEKELGEIREKMSNQEKTLGVYQEDLRECEAGIEELDRDYEERLSASRKEVEEIQTEYEYQRQELSTREGELKECNDALKLQALQFKFQEESNKETIEKLGKDLEDQKIETFDKDSKLQNCKDGYGELEKKLEEVEQKQKQDTEVYRQSLEKVWEECNENVQKTSEYERKTCDIELIKEKERAERIREEYQLDKNKYEVYIKDLEERIERLNAQYESNLELAKNKAFEMMENAIQDGRQKCQDQIRLAVETESASSNDTIAQLIKELNEEHRSREELVREYEEKLQTLTEKYVKGLKAQLLARSKTYNKEAENFKSVANRGREKLPERQSRVKRFQEKVEKNRKEGIVNQGLLRRTEMFERHLKTEIKRIEKQEERYEEYLRKAKEFREQSEKISE